jgi:enoyl-CoA hydratase
MEFENIRYEERDGKAYITLNRPEKLNALSVDLLEELGAAMWEADNRRDVHLVVLSGEGRAFSAGYDITPGRRAQGEGYRDGSTFDDDAWRMELTQRYKMAIFDMHKPVIAKVHGYCLAGGTDVALLCDMVIVADDAVIGFPPTRAQGTPPHQMWLYHVGPQWAKRILLTGDSISGVEAARIGFALESVPAVELDEHVEALADRLAMIDHELLSAQKRQINLGMELMGARTMQRLATEIDARAHLAPAAKEFGRISRDQGLKSALEWRDMKFGDGRGTTAYQKRKAATA